MPPAKKTAAAKKKTTSSTGKTPASTEPGSRQTKADTNVRNGLEATVKALEEPIDPATLATLRAMADDIDDIRRDGIPGASFYDTYTTVLAAVTGVEDDTEDDDNPFAAFTSGPPMGDTATH